MDLAVFTPEVGVKLARSLQQCIERAKALSQQYGGAVQHVNFDCNHTTYYVSDWYDSDSTVFSIQNGRAFNTGD